MDSTTMMIVGAVVLVVVVVASGMFSGASGAGDAPAAVAPGKKKKKTKKKAAAPAAAPADEAPKKKSKAKKKKKGGGGDAVGESKAAAPASGGDDAKAAGANKKKKAKGTPEERAARRAAEAERALEKAQQKLKGEQGKHDNEEDDDGFSIAVSKSTKKLQQKKRNPRPAQRQQASEGGESKGDTGYGSQAFTPVGMAPAQPQRKSKPVGGGGGGAVATGEQAAAEEPMHEGSVVVDGRKLGAIIGPGGETLKKIQDMTGTRINIPQRDEHARREGKPAKVKIEGATKDGVQAARKALEEFSKKGYATILQEGDFTESSVNVPLNYVSVLVGAGGSSIRNLQDNLQVNVVIPRGDKTATSGFMQARRKTHEKVLIAGPRPNVQRAKDCVKQLIKFYHSEATHPGHVHKEMAEIEAHNYSLIIGQRGSTIKHLQNNFKCQVYIPDEETHNPNVVITGLPANVAAAAAQIEKIILRATQEQDEAPVEDAAKAGRNVHDDDYEEPGEHESWMDDYMYRR